MEGHAPMPLMCASFSPGGLAGAVATIAREDADLGRIAQAEAHYFCARPQEAVSAASPYLGSDDPALRLSACFICGYANLSLNRIRDARRCLEGVVAADAPDGGGAGAENHATRATHILFSSAARVLLPPPSPQPPRTSIPWRRLCPRAYGSSRATCWHMRAICAASTADAWVWRRTPW